ncbi:MAG: hypothetical protein QG577_2162 [Thermodesulfobacteriota bacterium]|nr:hypothetical protein [Thermodesulfobacteriota bacterium]
MTVDGNLKEKSGDLRARAEELLRHKVAEIEDLSGPFQEDVQKLVHELHVHQIELEMQNDELRRAQLELEKARDKYQDLYDYAPVGYLMLDKSALVLEANLAVAGLLVIERRSLVGTPLTRFVDKEAQDTFYFHRTQVLETGDTQKCVVKFMRPDGSWFHGEVQSIRVKDSHDEVSRLRSSIADVTEKILAEVVLQESHDELEKRVEARTSELRESNQKLKREIVERARAQESLNESEQRLALALSGAGLGAWDYDIQTGKTIFDQRWSEMLGYFTDEIEPHISAWESMIHPEDRSRVLKTWKEHEADRTPLYEAEYRLRTKSGQWKWILGRGTIVERDGQGKPLRAAGTHLDISDRKHVEESARFNTYLLQAIFEGSPDMIFIKDRDLKYTHVNPAMATNFGRAASEIIGRSDEEHFGRGTVEHLRLVDLRVLQGEFIEEEYQATIDNIPITLNTVLSPLRDLNGSIIGIYGISRDVTDRKRIAVKPKPIPDSYPSSTMKAVLKDARKAASTDSIILLTGESGSGKDYVARWIHDQSRRAAGPYIALNCAAIARELAESELFGHERGSFTGAHHRKRGMLELAEGGTILLNEIGELSLALQSKLLTFLDTRSFLRVGGEKSVKANARIMAATNRSLEVEVAEGRFLAPLLYRLNVLTLTIPPLRDRIDDIPVLLEEIVSRLAKDLQLTSLPAVPPNTVIALSRYHWPGNVRELRNVIERALILSDGKSLNLVLPSADASDGVWSHTSTFPEHERTLHDVTDEVIESLCLEALRRCDGNRRCAARTLGIARDSLYRHMKRFAIAPADPTKDESD